MVITDLNDAQRKNKEILKNTKGEKAMNMLNPEMKALCTFSEEVKELFNEARKEGLVEKLVGHGVWKDRDYSSNTLTGCGVYRLKLKEGEWYNVDNVLMKFVEKIKDDLNKGYRFENTDGNSVYPDLNIRYAKPATQEEIDSVKPKETFVDVPLNWDGPYVPGVECPEMSIRTCFVYADESISPKSVRVNALGTKIKEKATHARFVKVGE